jgi:hypothetical protein
MLKAFKECLVRVLPTICPSCNQKLKVKRLVCEKCDTEIEGLYELPQLAKLSPDEQGFVIEFIKASGSLKEMARLLRLSYPTVRNRLDDIIERVKLTENTNANNRRQSV